MQNNTCPSAKSDMTNDCIRDVLGQFDITIKQVDCSCSKDTDCCDECCDFYNHDQDEFCHPFDLSKKYFFVLPDLEAFESLQDARDYVADIIDEDPEALDDILVVKCYPGEIFSPEKNTKLTRLFKDN